MPSKAADVGQQAQCLPPLQKAWRSSISSATSTEICYTSISEEETEGPDRRTEVQSYLSTQQVQGQPGIQETVSESP